MDTAEIMISTTHSGAVGRPRPTKPGVRGSVRNFLAHIPRNLLRVRHIRFKLREIIDMCVIYINASTTIGKFSRAYASALQ